MLQQISRSIYRSVATDIRPDRFGGIDQTAHMRVQKSCDENLGRLLSDREYFAKPAKTLFQEVRAYFPLDSQQRLWAVIDRHVAVATRYVDSLPKTGVDNQGNPIECRATTRRGTNCRRTPLAHNGYCPSHQHLAQTEHVRSIAA